MFLYCGVYSFTLLLAAHFSLTLYILIICIELWGTRWRSWLRHCATSRRVAGSIPDGVNGHTPSGHTVALGLTQPLTEMSTTNISWW